MNTTYKENLLINAKSMCKPAGVRMRVYGIGNDRHVRLAAKDRAVLVWFPIDSRVHDLEIVDLKEAIREMTGKEMFS